MAPDVVFDFSLENATSNTDGLQLVDCAGTVIDVVIYGEQMMVGWTSKVISPYPLRLNQEMVQALVDTDGGYQRQWPRL